MNFVHDDAEFSDLVHIVATARRIAPALVEKDYWATHTLWALLHQGFDVWFKGGTSLAKGFGLIERFSEDLDLKIEPGAVPGLPSVSNWKSTSKAASIDRHRYFVSLAKEIRVTAATVDLVPTADPSCRSAELRVHYPGQLLGDLGPSFRPFVLLEVGNARVVPSVAVDASSFVHEHLAHAGQAAGFLDNRPRCLRCVHPLVTLIEKLDAIRRRFDNGAAPATFVRHFEDAAHVIAKAALLPALTEYRHPRELANEMLDHRQLAGTLSASHVAFRPIARRVGQPFGGPMKPSTRCSRDSASRSPPPVPRSAPGSPPRWTSGSRAGDCGLPWFSARASSSARASLLRLPLPPRSPLSLRATRT